VGLVSPACQVHLHCLGLLLVLSQYDSALIVNISPEIFESGLSRALRLLNNLAKTVAACLKRAVDQGSGPALNAYNRLCQGPTYCSILSI
jgi:hypothetical protein